MGTEVRHRISFGLIFLILLVIAASAFVVYYSKMERESASKKMAEIIAGYGAANYDKQKLPEGITTDSTFLALFRQKVYLQSKVALARTDSVYLTIDLPDSLVNIEISGVVVHSVHIKEIEVSKLITDGDNFTITSLFSTPLTIVNDTSSIQKVPILTKVAPKDTSEFVPNAVPDTAVHEPVNYILETDRDVRIIVYQSEEINKGDNKDRFRFDLHNRIEKAVIAFKDIMAFKVPEYHPFIRIQIPQADARIIYRAIPKHGQIIVYP